MATYNISEFKARLSSFINRALAGEEIIVARSNKPLLKLVPIERPRGRRMPGSARDKAKLADDFDMTPRDFGEYTVVRVASLPRQQ